MSYYESWQKSRFNNVLQEQPAPNEEYEYLHNESRAQSEWTAQVAELQQIEN